MSAFGGLVAIISLVIWWGGSPAPDGTPWITDPDKIILAIVGGFVALVSPVIPILLGIWKDTAATTEHVVNSHSDAILRDDIDELLTLARSTERRVGRLESISDQQGKDVLGIRDEIGQIRRTERDQWDAIERTGGRGKTD